MPELNRVEAAVCRSAPWGFVAGHLALPWALQGAELEGDVLEIGGGSGATAAEAARRFPGAKITVTDVDGQMVAHARSLGIDAVQADAAALPFEGESFDAVLSFLMLHHVEAWERALAEAARVLRPGGLLLGYDVLGGRIAHARHPTLEELDLALSTLPFTAVWIRPSFGLFMRFKATKR